MSCGSAEDPPAIDSSATNAGSTPAQSSAANAAAQETSASSKSTKASAPHQEPSAKTETLHQFLCRVRNMPESPPDATPRHYYLRGRIHFILDDPNAEVIEQGLDLSVAGPDRMKLILRTFGRQQVFFLADAEHAWLRLPDGAKPTEYDSEELAQDTALRWIAMQFPWIDANAIYLPGEKTERGEPAYLSQLNEGLIPPMDILDENGEPQCVLEFDKNGLLLSIRTWDEQNKNEVVALELSDWKAGSSGWMYPSVWTWHKSWGRVEEHFELIADESLFLDRYFIPSTEGEGTAFLTGHGSLSPLRSAEQIGVAAITLRWFDETAWTELEDKPVARLWSRIPANGEPSQVYLLDEQADASGLSVQETAAGQEWLRWRTFKELDPQKARANLQNIAERSGLEVNGELWIRQPQSGVVEGERIYLLAVRKKS